MTDTSPPPKSRTMGAGVGLIGAVGVATLLAILFRGGGRGSGSGGSGAGTGTGASNVAATAPAQPTRPLKVRIEGSDYVVDGRAVPLVTLVELAEKVPAGSGPAVLVERPGSSKAKAEVDLQDALNKKGISNASD